MKKPQNGKKRLIIDREKPRVRLPSVSLALKDNECCKAKLNEKQNSGSTPKIMEESATTNSKALTPLMKRHSKIGRSLSKLRERSQSTKNNTKINHEKKEEITSASRRQQQIYRHPQRLSEEQVKCFLRNQDWHSKQNIFNFTQNKILHVLLQFQDYRRQATQSSIKIVQEAQKKNQTHSTRTKHMDIISQVSATIAPEKQALKLCPRQINVHCSWSACIKESSLVWDICQGNQEDHTKEVLEFFRKRVSCMEEQLALKKNKIDLIEKQINQKLSVVSTYSQNIEKIQKQIQEKRQILSEFSQKIKHMDKFYWKTNNKCSGKDQTSQCKKIEQKLMQLALRSNQLLSGEYRPSLQKVTADQDIRFNIDLDMLYQELTAKGRDEVDRWRSIFAYKSKIKNCYNATKSKIHQKVYEKLDQTRIFASLVKKMAEMCSAKKNVMKNMRDDMIKAVLKLDELMTKIERKLPDLVPNLNDNHPIVKYYRDLQEMIQKIISINDEINLNS